MDTVGIDEFVKECDRMAQQYGERFNVPGILREMADKGETWYGSKASQKAA